jgi:hypothetical protein
VIDDLGRQALRNGLSQVIIKNSGGIGSTTGITYDKGVLTMDHSAVTNIDDVDEHASHIQKILEKPLSNARHRQCPVQAGRLWSGLAEDRFCHLSELFQMENFAANGARFRATMIT